MKSIAISQRQVANAALRYFALVFGAGFALGSIRVPLLVPKFGVRIAELMETPVMFVVIVLASRFVVHRYSLPCAKRAALGVGLLALAMLVCAELLMAVALAGRSLTQYISSRDPVSGSVYLCMLVLFALMPWLVSLRFVRKGR